MLIYYNNFLLERKEDNGDLTCDLSIMEQML